MIITQVTESTPGGAGYLQAPEKHSHRITYLPVKADGPRPTSMTGSGAMDDKTIPAPYHASAAGPRDRASFSPSRKSASCAARKGRNLPYRRRSGRGQDSRRRQLYEHHAPAQRALRWTAAEGRRRAAYSPSPPETLACKFPPRLTVAATSVACVPVRSTSPVSSASARPAKLPARRWPRKRVFAYRNARPISPGSWSLRLDYVEINGNMEHHLLQQPSRKLRLFMSKANRS